jgi:hypothetical protein
MQSNASPTVSSDTVLVSQPWGSVEPCGRVKTTVTSLVYHPVPHAGRSPGWSIRGAGRGQNEHRRGSSQSGEPSPRHSRAIPATNAPLTSTSPATTSATAVEMPPSGIDRANDDPCRDGRPRPTGRRIGSPCASWRHWTEAQACCVSSAARQAPNERLPNDGRRRCDSYGQAPAEQRPPGSRPVRSGATASEGLDPVRLPPRRQAPRERTRQAPAARAVRSWSKGSAARWSGCTTGAFPRWTRSTYAAFPVLGTSHMSRAGAPGCGMPRPPPTSGSRP